MKRRNQVDLVEPKVFLRRPEEGIETRVPRFVVPSQSFEGDLNEKGFNPPTWRRDAEGRARPAGDPKKKEKGPGGRAGRQYLLVTLVLGRRRRLPS